MPIADKKYDTANVDLVLKGPNGREYKISPLKEEDMRKTFLRSFETKCCGCGEKDLNKLDTVTITIPYKKVTLKPGAFICYDCTDKIRRKEGDARN